MATYTKETALFDTGAISGDIQDASETASKYISTDSTGIMIYDGESGQQTPSNPNSTTNNVFIDENSLDIRKGTDVLASFGETVKIGPEGSSQITISGASFEGATDQGVSSFSINGNGTSMPSYVSAEWRASLQRSSVVEISCSYILSGVASDTDVTISVVYKSKRVDFTAKKGGSATRTATTAISDAITLNCKYFESSETLRLWQSGNPGSDVNVYTARLKTYKTVPAPYYTFGTRNSSESLLGAYSFASGYNLKASSEYSHAEGNGTTASGIAAHAEGVSTIASGNYGSHAEGASTKAIGMRCHAEGDGTTAGGGGSHAEGCESIAQGAYCHAEGYQTKANGASSHAQNKGTIATRQSQTALGEFNIEEEGSTLSRGVYSVIIGNGEDKNSRSNALTVDWDGRVECGDYSGNFKSIFDIFYPVGSYYETSDTSFDPNVAWGGTWVKDSAGKVTVAQDTSDTSFDTIGETGGSKYIQAHTHSFTQPTITSYYNNNASYGSGSASRPYTGGSHTTTGWNKATGGAVGAVSGVTTGSAGNLQPYIVVNRWHRTA